MSLALVPREAQTVEPELPAPRDLRLSDEYFRVLSHRSLGFGLSAHLDLPVPTAEPGPHKHAGRPRETASSAARPWKSTPPSLRSRLARRLSNQSRWLDAFAIIFFALTSAHLLTTPFRFAPIPEGRLIFDGISALSFVGYFFLRTSREYTIDFLALLCYILNTMKNKEKHRERL